MKWHCLQICWMHIKLSADLSLVNARINVIYNYYKMKYITHTL
mgnify:CR=1 FL=1